MLKILLADDHLIVRQGVRSLLERSGLMIVVEASDGREAVRLAGEIRPDVAVLDLGMPVLNGLDAAREMLRASYCEKIIILTMHTDDTYLLQALRAGAKGIVLKSRAVSDLVAAINEVHRGSLHLSPGLSTDIVAAFVGKTELPVDPLTARERQVLQLIAEGKSTKEVAALLGLSIKTAESHRSKLMQKLDIHETAGLVRYAVRTGLIIP